MTRNTILIAGAAVVFGMWWTAPLRHQAEYFNECVTTRVSWQEAYDGEPLKANELANVQAKSVAQCNGGTAY